MVLFELDLLFGGTLIVEGKGPIDFVYVIFGTI
jgi:hypothetical protein